MGLISASVRFLAGVRAFDVAVVDANGNQITSFGGNGSSVGSSASIIPIVPSNQSQVLLAADPATKHFYISNNTQKTLLYAYGPAASALAYTGFIPARSEQKFEGYNGVVSGVWENNPNGDCMVTKVV